MYALAILGSSKSKIPNLYDVYVNFVRTLPKLHTWHCHFGAQSSAAGLGLGPGVDNENIIHEICLHFFWCMVRYKEHFASWAFMSGREASNHRNKWNEAEARKEAYLNSAYLVNVHYGCGLKLTTRNKHGEMSIHIAEHKNFNDHLDRAASASPTLKLGSCGCFLLSMLYMCQFSTKNLIRYKLWNVSKYS